MILKLAVSAILFGAVAIAQTPTQQSVMAKTVEKTAGIHWKKSYKEALESAQKEDKPFMFIISRHTCRYCVQLEKTALSDAEVIATLNDKFIANTAYTDDDDYFPPELWNGGTPMIWFLLPNGTPMFQPIPGAIPTKDFKEALAVVLQEYETLKKLKKTKTK